MEIKAYIENYQLLHDLKVVSMTYDVEPEKGSLLGSIQVSGQLELGEPLYVEDEGNRSFREIVAKMLARNRFSKREINHDIYDRVIRASVRVPGDGNEYYTLLKVEHEPGLEINFSADLVYATTDSGFRLDGPVRHAKLLGSRMSKFSNPALHDGELTQKAVENVLSEQTRYRELMLESRALLTQLWNNDFGFVVWNRKISYLGNENLSPQEHSQLAEFKNWRGVYHISNIKPVQYRTPHASNFFELGSYTTEGVATCLRQTGFIDQLSFLKSNFSQYCEFGKQYSARIKLGSWLDETNEFVAKVEFEIGGINSGEFSHDSKQFTRKRNELARYSDQLQLTLLDEHFDINHHTRPIFSTIDTLPGEPERLSLLYSGGSSYPSTIESEIDESFVAAQKAEAAKTVPQKEIVKAIQVELKRLSVYFSSIDGVPGGQTYWGMQHVKQQLGKDNIEIPSAEFLALLIDTPTGSIAPPETPYSPEPTGEPIAETNDRPKEYLAGKALKGTGRALNNAARWFGKKFGKKKD